MSGSIRLFVNAALAEDAEVAASPQQAHYLGRVMRQGPGDPVRLFNGRDGEWEARIVRLERGGLLRLGRRLRPQAAGPDLWLLFGMLKREATDLVVQKATELGAAMLQPVVTARSQPHRPSAARLSAIAVEAAEQCERLDVPVIAAPRPLAAVLAGWPAGRRLVLAAERQAAPPVPPGSGPAALLVGPEGGFAPAEFDALLAAGFVVPASLGPRILRAETAAIVGLALLESALRSAPPCLDGR